MSYNNTYFSKALQSSHCLYEKKPCDDCSYSHLSLPSPLRARETNKPLELLLEVLLLEVLLFSLLFAWSLSSLTLEGVTRDGCEATTEVDEETSWPNAWHEVDSSLVPGTPSSEPLAESALSPSSDCAVMIGKAAAQQWNFLKQCVNSFTPRHFTSSSLQAHNLYIKNIMKLVTKTVLEMNLNHSYFWSKISLECSLNIKNIN